MTSEQLSELVTNKANQLLGGFALNEMQTAIFEEVCENITKSNDLKDMSDNAIILSTLTAFNTCQEIMKGLIKASLENADEVNITYRGKTFHYDDNVSY